MPGLAGRLRHDTIRRILRHIDPLDEQRDVSCLLGREELVSDPGEVGEQARDVTLADLVLASLRKAGRGSPLAAPANEEFPQRTRANRTSTSWATGRGT